MFRRLALWSLVFVLQLQSFVAVGAVHCESKEHDSYSQQATENTDHGIIQTTSGHADDHQHDGLNSAKDNLASDDSTCHSSCPMAISSSNITHSAILASVEPPHFANNPLATILDTPKRPPRLA